jgi:hypothetical protein
MTVKSDRLYVDLGPSQTRRRLKGQGFGVRKVRARRVSTTMDDRPKLEAKWNENEDELNRIAGMTRLDQHLIEKRVEEPLAEQDAIEFEIGPRLRYANRC